MFRGADRVVVLGRRAYVATDVLGASPGRWRCLHNCVPDPGPHPSGGRREPVIVFLGRLGGAGRVPELFARLADPAMATLGWRAVLAGAGRSRPAGRPRPSASPSGDCQVGWRRAETRALCRQGDILVLPSHREGMAMAVLEGLAHGLAVVTTPVGAHDEAIDDGKAGSSCPSVTREALATVLAGLVADPERRAALPPGLGTLRSESFRMASYLPALRHLYAGLATEPGLETPVERRPT